LLSGHALPPTLHTQPSPLTNLWAHTPHTTMVTAFQDDSQTAPTPPWDASRQATYPTATNASSMFSSCRRAYLTTCPAAPVWHGISTHWWDTFGSIPGPDSVFAAGGRRANCWTPPPSTSTLPGTARHTYHLARTTPPKETILWRHSSTRGATGAGGRHAPQHTSRQTLFRPRASYHAARGGRYLPYCPCTRTHLASTTPRAGRAARCYSATAPTGQAVTHLSNSCCSGQVVSSTPARTRTCCLHTTHTPLSFPARTACLHSLPHHKRAAYIAPDRHHSERLLAAVGDHHHLYKPTGFANDTAPYRHCC